MTQNSDEHVLVRQLADLLNRTWPYIAYHASKEGSAAKDLAMQIDVALNQARGLNK
jgi:hypothetical protein